MPVGPVPDGADPAEYERLRRRVLWKLPDGPLPAREPGRRAPEPHDLELGHAGVGRPEATSRSRSSDSAVTHGLIVEGGCFSLSLVARDDKEVVRKFVKPAEHDAEAHTLAGFAYRDGLSGAPIPELAIGYLDCGLRHSLGLGSHSLVRRRGPRRRVRPRRRGCPGSSHGGHPYELWR